jgi:hypothetical protein
LGYRYLFPLSPFHKTRDTPRRVKQGGSKKSFGIGSWHLLRRSEKTATKRKNGKRILGLITDKGGSAFFGKGCCENARVPGGKKKKTGKIFQKLDAGYFYQRKLFWDTPVYHV